MKRIPVLMMVVALAVPALADEATAPHAKVVYSGIDTEQAEALAKTISAARKVYVQDFGLDMPETVILTVTCEPEQAVRLYNDGQDRLFLSLSSKDQLAKPAKSGVFNLYGMCHELGHIGMYRTLKNRDWMTIAAAEGWAHYAGSVVVDLVFKAEGEDLWPDKYDYRQDGMPRLDKELTKRAPSDVALGAAQWRDLEKIIERRGFAKLFMAWEKAKIDPADPGKGLLAALTKVRPEQEAELKKWSKAASPLFVEKREGSEFKAEEIKASRLTGHPLEVALDDGGSEGKKSIAGGGHARKFTAPGPGDWYIVGVSVFGARYGPEKAPDAKFDVALCDENMKQIAVWPQSFDQFERGDLSWVNIELPPTRVPKTFYICLNFRPTATNGVFVGFDDSTKGDSLVATPGDKGSPLKGSDWMIRLQLDQPKKSDFLITEPAPAKKPGKTKKRE